MPVATVGGAIATIPEMHRYLVLQKGWLTDPVFASSVALVSGSDSVSRPSSALFATASMPRFVRLARCPSRARSVASAPNSGSPSTGCTAPLSGSAIVRSMFRHSSTSGRE